MNFGYGNNASFFKVLRYDSADYLRLPPAFAKKYLEMNSNKKKQTFVLITESGKKWIVEFVKMDDRYFLLDGWDKFMKDNHLKAEDFLVFWLVSGSPGFKFRVFCYAPNGCLKNPTSTNNSSTSSNEKRVKKPSVERETICDDDSSQNVLTRVIRKSYIRQMPLTRSFVKAAGIDGYCELLLVNDDGDTWHVNLKEWGQTRIPFIVGWVSFVKDNNVMIGNRCDISHVKGNLLRVHVYKVRGRRAFGKKPATK